MKANKKFITHRAVALGSSKNLELLSQSKRLWIDGTFKCVPDIFQQLVTIHGFYENRMWPLVHILVNSKVTECYDWLFRTH